MKLRSRKAANIAAAGIMTLSGVLVIGISEAVTTSKAVGNDVSVTKEAGNLASNKDKKEIDAVLQAASFDKLMAGNPEKETTSNTADSSTEKTSTDQGTQNQEVSSKEEETKESETQSETKPTVENLEYANKFIVNVSEYLNIRELPDSNAGVLGKLYPGAGGEVLEKGSEWTKISSGSVVGYVSNDYVLFGDAAMTKAKEVGDLKVTILVDNLRVRKSPSLEAGVWGLADINSVFEGKEIENGWVSINYDGELAYVSLEYAQAKMELKSAVSIEEEQEQLRLQAEEEARKEAEKQRKEEEAMAALKQAEAESQYVETVKTSPYSVSESDVYLLACLVHAEAGWEPYDGKLAVANVVLNRLSSGRYGGSMHDVIYARGQFTVAASGRLSTVMSQGPNAESVQAAEEALAGVNNVPDYYGFCSQSAASYGRYNNYSIIGTQVFYN